MKFLLTSLVFILVYSTITAQFVIKREVKEDVPGLCDRNEVYALLPMVKGQEAAVCPVAKEEILKRLNAEVTFIKQNPKFKGKGMIGLLISCKGEVVECKMDNKTKNEELDKQIEAVFNSLGAWKAGKLNSKEVDSSILYSFKIKDGEFTFD